MLAIGTENKPVKYSTGNGGSDDGGGSGVL